LKRLSLDCDFRDVTAQLHKEEAIRDAFIGGLTSNEIRQRLLEDDTLTLETAFTKARSLEIAQKNPEVYQNNSSQQPTSVQNVANLQPSLQDEDVSKTLVPN